MVDFCRPGHIFQGNSRVLFTGNYADSRGGVMYISSNHYSNSTIAFQGNCTVEFTENYNRNDGEDIYGGVMYIDGYTRSAITFRGNSMVSFNENRATNGGVIYIDFYSISAIIIFKKTP